MATTVQFHEKTATISEEKWRCAHLGFAAMLDGVLFDHRDEWITGKYLLDPDLVIALETIAFVNIGVIVTDQNTPAEREIDANTDGSERVY
jgi:hypothetical protein